ncbi:hypothetical protein DSO57_1001216 [Entomophthora muscae]|uniref:Uncharacterized protein n=1 Tax=Entomophthora muscae TaxID=34485 RepID=A0ACC2TWD7_9FUNG|nr:hypothetical protein DSO57_1001216 [Entomophthora muscae]
MGSNNFIVPLRALYQRHSRIPRSHAFCSSLFHSDLGELPQAQYKFRFYGKRWFGSPCSTFSQQDEKDVDLSEGLISLLSTRNHQKGNIITHSSDNPSTRKNEFLQHVLQSHIAKGNHKEAVETIDLFSIQETPEIDAATIKNVMASCLKWYRYKDPSTRIVYIKPEGVELMERLLEPLDRLGLVPNISIINMLLYAFSLSPSPGMEKSFSLLQRPDVEPNIITYNIVMLGYVRRGLIWKARDVYRDILHKGLSPSLYTFSTLIYAFIKKKNLPSALRYFYEMLHLGLKPNNFIINHMIYGHLQSHNPSEAINLFNALLKERHVPTLHTLETLIKGLCRLQQLSEAREIFFNASSYLPTANEAIYRELIYAHFQAEDFEMAKKFWLHYIQTFTPTHEMMDLFLSGLIYTNRLQEAEVSFKHLLKVYNYTPSPETAQLLIDNNMMNQQ